MKTGIERLKQQRADSDRKKAAAAEKLAELKKKRADMEAKVNAAIAEDDQVNAEKLIRARLDIDIQIEIAQKTLVNLEKSINRAAVAAAWADDLSDYQKQIDRAEKELNQLIRQAVEKALAIADAVNVSWDARTDALALIDDQEPSTYNFGNSDFPGVSFTAKTLEAVSELLSPEELKAIRPDAAGTLSLATVNRTNIYFQRK